MTPDDEIPQDAPEQEETRNPETSNAPADPYAELEADVQKWKELAVRTAADLDNFRKRSAREREESVRYANQGLLEDLLPILDNFEMGMQAAEKEQGSMIYIGMDMVRRQMSDFLANQGVKEVPMEGIFDPNLHDAMAEEVNDDVPEGTILRVVRRGFTLRDRLLRPATVVVAKSGSKNDGGEG